MSGPDVGTVWSSPSGLKLVIVSLLLCTNTVCLQENNKAQDHNLQCVSDYVSRINCSLSLAASENSSDSSSSSYWLELFQTSSEEEFSCVLKNTSLNYFCSVEISSPMTDDYYNSTKFWEGDNFAISLCHAENDKPETCDLLTENFRPFKNIKPNAPCCLKHSYQSDQHHFIWKSTYEPYIESDPLGEDLMYELHYYGKGDKQGSRSHTVSTDRLNFSISDDEFVRDTEYSARVRSSPNQVYYKGQWSDWTSEIHWRTKSAGTAQQTDKIMSQALKVLIPVCVIMPLVLLLCYAPIKRWRQGSYIPTPAPYFHTLYHDCQGDFKSWVITQEKTADMLKAEESLQIDTLTECADVQEEQEEKRQPQFLEGGMYSNISDHGCGTSLPGVPYAVSSMAPLSDPESSPKSLTFSSQQSSPAEGDSGCWLSSHTSLEREPPWYCNEYCTLNAFQQISQNTAMKSCSTTEEQTEAFI